MPASHGNRYAWTAASMSQPIRTSTRISLTNGGMWLRLCVTVTCTSFSSVSTGLVYTMSLGAVFLRGTACLPCTGGGAKVLVSLTFLALCCMYSIPFVCVVSNVTLSPYLMTTIDSVHQMIAYNGHTH